MVTSHMYERELNASAIWGAVFAIIVMGVLCAVLYLADLSAVWHMTLVIAVAVVLLCAILGHGVQAICVQIHTSIEYLSGAP